MKYFGGKARICKDIQKILNKEIKEGQTFLSPFVGGGWVEQYIKADKKLLSDAHIYLIELYKALQNGYELPNELSKEEYLYIKENLDEDKALSGFVGFGCSHSGKFFRGYAKDSIGYNYCLGAKKSMQKKIDNGLLENSEFYCRDYREWKPTNCVIYCDPPYNNTEPLDYKVLYQGKRIDKFDTDEFWNTMREWSKNNKVFISEYDAPDDFECVWEQEIKLMMKNKQNTKDVRVEKLFTYKGGV